jgi:hypothetical protein
MLDMIFVIAFLAGLIWVGTRAFTRPDGVYRTSILGFLGAVAMAAATWLAAGSFISNEAGLGALVVFLMIVAAAAIVAIVACAAATARHVIDAWS